MALTTVLDMLFPNSTNTAKWYWSSEADQLQPVLHATDGVDNYAQVNITGASAAARLWWDGNHIVGPAGQINLLFVSWRDGADPARPGGIDAFPAAYGDLRNAEIIFTCRVDDFYLPDNARIALWFQTKILDAYTNGVDEYTYANYFQCIDLLDDRLGFGGRGLGVPKSAHGVKKTDWRDITVRLSAQEAYWLAMGSWLGKTGITGQTQGNYYNYSAHRHVSDGLAAWIANMGLIVIWGRQASSATPPYPTVPILGKFQVKRVQLKVQV